MVNDKRVDKAIEAVINLAAAIGVTEKELIAILDEAIRFDTSGAYTDYTIDIVADLVGSPEFDIKL